jgi:hypothetical protein
MIVVPMLMTSCQVSLNLNIGPVLDQTKMMSTAVTKVVGCPAAREVPLAKLVKAGEH